MRRCPNGGAGESPLSCRARRYSGTPRGACASSGHAGETNEAHRAEFPRLDDGAAGLGGRRHEERGEPRHPALVTRRSCKPLCFLPVADDVGLLAAAFGPPGGSSIPPAASFTPFNIPPISCRCGVHWPPLWVHAFASLWLNAASAGGLSSDAHKACGLRCKSPILSLAADPGHR